MLLHIICIEWFDSKLKREFKNTFKKLFGNLEKKLKRNFTSPSHSPWLLAHSASPSLQPNSQPARTRVSALGLAQQSSVGAAQSSAGAAPLSLFG
jgi:hypothetical protein